MTLDQIKEYGNCCVTDKRLSTSKGMNAVQLHYKATWQHPPWGTSLRVRPIWLLPLFMMTPLIRMVMLVL